MPMDSGNPQPATPQGADSAADFAAGLRELRAAAGSPSFRHLAKITHYSSSALAEATSGKRLPSEALVRAFATGCGADPGEWAARLQRAVAGKEAPRTATPQAGSPGAGSPSPAVVRVSHASDGEDPHVAGCYADGQLVDKSPVMLQGVQIGAVELIYSHLCAAGWARAYLYPGQPTMLGQVTVRASDGRLVAFANPMIKQVPIYTDVIVPHPGGCPAATAIFYPAAHAPITASVTCQMPTGIGQGTG